MTHYHSKSIRKKLRKLAGLAHERELSMALEMLNKQEHKGCPLDYWFAVVFCEGIGWIVAVHGLKLEIGK